MSVRCLLATCRYEIRPMELCHCQDRALLKHYQPHAVRLSQHRTMHALPCCTRPVSRAVAARHSLQCGADRGQAGRHRPQHGPGAREAPRSHCCHSGLCHCLHARGPQVCCSLLSQCNLSLVTWSAVMPALMVHLACFTQQMLLLLGSTVCYATMQVRLRLLLPTHLDRSFQMVRS